MGEKIKLPMNDIIKGVKFALVFGLNIGFIIGIVKGVSLVYSNGYFQNSLYNLALDTIQLNLNSTVLVSVIIPIAAIIALMIIKIYREKGLVLISSLTILLYVASFGRISPFSCLLFVLILYGLLYPIGISAKLREKFSFINKIANTKLISVPIILILICNGFIYSYRLPTCSKGPNIILISIDALRADHLGCYGYHRKTSPNIDRIAREGVLFKNGFSQVTWTLASHASIFLSQYKWRHNVDNPQTNRLSPSCTTLAEILKNENYTTAAFTGGIILSSRYGFNQGFEIYDDGIPGDRTRQEIASYIDKLLNWLESVRNKKFFLFIHTYDVHSPYNPPSPYFNLYTNGYSQRKSLTTSGGIIANFKIDASRLTSQEIDYIIGVYDGSINYVDYQLGRIFEKLNQLGIDDNTIVIATADHGEAFREHGKLGHCGKPYFDIDTRTLAHIEHLKKGYNSFKFEAMGGDLTKGVIGVMGANGTGKTTFVKLLAGVIKPDEGSVDVEVKTSYKPQYLTQNEDTHESVGSFLKSITDLYDSSYYRTEILRPLQLERMLERPLETLSGGELQRVAIAACLSRNADLFMLDEPSAHLDVEQRALATSLIRRFTENKKVGTLLVDHDIYMIDLASQRLMVFTGKPGENGKAEGPFDMHTGMNRFLKHIEITFRRDENSHRPRVNKTGSKLDRKQRDEGEYYYPEQ